MRASPIARTLFWMLLALALCVGLYLHGSIGLGFLQNEGRWVSRGVDAPALTAVADLRC
ncbi:hypothetical protein SAMN06295912_111115 [Sphingomonas laterariae]|uniref:Uncharacterized protein n=1 Tax=Edaphosphingomonas laterariae TaxID=861865 RepID=A0A239GDY1_9SPHN|nr:hypothetical protein [Sphingomonas laterariae]SNS66264.1 hypothetical protein SAMN06295912_111115 [Sphingomonas laterariae]